MQNHAASSGKQGAAVPISHETTREKTLTLHSANLTQEYEIPLHDLKQFRGAESRIGHAGSIWRIPRTILLLCIDETGTSFW